MAGLRLDKVSPRVLAPVDLDCPSGGLAFLFGPSGSGKSLLLRAVADLDPHSGEVWLDDEARSTMAPSRWRRRVGLLPAESFWWADDVGTHFPAQARAGAAVTALLADLDFAPDVLGWSVARLSTGERQRLALARLLAQGPEAVLLDEATANLDPGNRERVESVVIAYRLQHQAAVLWVSHDADQRERLAANGAGEQYTINAGRLERLT